jgi:nucleoid DNA-binding protein
MIKSELIERISSQNPHLFQRDIEKIVTAILDQIAFGDIRKPPSTLGAV